MARSYLLISPDNSPCACRIHFQFQSCIQVKYKMNKLVLLAFVAACIAVAVARTPFDEKYDDEAADLQPGDISFRELS